MEPIQVRFASWLGWSQIALAPVAITVLFVCFGEDFPRAIQRDPAIVLGLVPGLITTVIGVLLLRRPMFVAHADAVEVMGLAGPAKKSYGIRSLRDIAIEGKGVFIILGDGSRKKIAVAGIVRKADLETLASAIEHVRRRSARPKNVTGQSS
jgi:hypothetical protein